MPTGSDGARGGGVVDDLRQPLGRDVGDVHRNLRLLDQPCVENFLEEFQNARGTRLEEIDLNHTQPLLGRNQNPDAREKNVYLGH